MTAMELKDHGNKLFTARNYEGAIGCYTKAIVKSPHTYKLYTNRALCHLKTKNWDSAIQDCKKALDIDLSAVKGHFFMGQAFVELGQYDEACASLKRAHELAKEQKLNFGDDITSAIRIAKKKRWNCIEEKRIQEEIELQTYLNSLINDEEERQINAVKEGGDSGDMEDKISKIRELQSKRLREVNELFTQLDIRRQSRDIPDYLCGKISFELMREPVITPSGITYDKKDIIEHLQRVGHFDPVTRKHLEQDDLIPNLAMKEVVDVFLEQNQWAEDY